MNLATVTLASEASVATKVRCMAERVRWGHHEITQRGIDPCRLAIEGDPDAPEAFAFLVLGDSGTGLHRRGTPQRWIGCGSTTRTTTAGPAVIRSPLASK